MSCPERPEDSPSKRITRYDEYFDHRTLSTKLRKTNKPKPEKRPSGRKPVLVVRRIIDRRGNYSHSQVDIKSETLCKVLLEINAGVEGLDLTRDSPTADPSLFFHSLQGLQERLEMAKSNTAPDSTLVDDIEVAIQFIAEDFASTLLDFSKLIRQQEITYDLLWALFKPNSLVFHYHDPTEQERILFVRSVEYTQSQNGTRYAAINCDLVTNDGRLFGLARDTIEIDTFAGTRNIQELAVYPLQYHPNRDAIRERTVQRGKRYVQMRPQSYHEITGQAIRATSSSDSMKFYVHGRIMVDPTTFHRYNPQCPYNLRVYRSLESHALTDDQYMICTPVLLGFCLSAKVWGGYAMDRLKNIKWNDEAFSALVLGSKQKDLIHALVKNHAGHEEHGEEGDQTTRPDFDDIIQGKGKGLVGLLSGPPGCGKTLTAEAVAEVTRRPLYMISAGELGTDPNDVDSRLEDILELTQLWNAVLLLDEAEVFLQRRDITNIKRNALVAIFLRQLEYYQGILILTTNMVQQCDPAFESRIHFSVHYPELDFSARKSIWRTFIGRATKATSDHPTVLYDEDVDRLAINPLNGRQIKNAVSSAQCIARSKGSPLKMEYINTVLEVLHDWKQAKDASGK